MKRGVALLLLAFVPAVALADEVPVRPARPTSYGEYLAGGPYCGIYAVFGALKAEGLEVPFEALVQARYVGDRKSVV